MKTLNTIILIFTSGIIFSQQGDYYSTINEAELLITQGNYIKAESLYEEAFENNKNVSVFDIYNSLMVLSEINNNSKYLKSINRDLEFLVSRAGLTLKFFEINEDLNTFKMDSSLWIKFLNNYPKLRKHFINNSDLSYRESLKLFEEWDQSFRKYDYYKFKPYSTSDSIIFNKVLKEIDKKGYPFCNIVGINFSSTKPYLSYGTTLPIWNSILHTAYRKDKTFKDIILPKWFNDNFIDPELVGYLLSLYNEKTPIEGGIHNFLSFLEDDTGIYNQNISESKEKLINEYRKTYSLCSIKDHKAKLLFQLKNPKFILVPHKGIATIKGIDQLIPILLKMGKIEKVKLVDEKK